ncbi:MAG: hypothetical protein L3J21_09830 [Devosiaceae bacterium]|nr:hypothetical protein [Devosiaceae bacterium]
MINKKYNSDVQYAVIDASTSFNQIVAGKSGVKYRVISCLLVAAGDVIVRFESGNGGDAMTGQMQLGNNTGFSLNENASGWFETNKGDGLFLELNAAVSVQGCLTYIQTLPGQK